MERLLVTWQGITRAQAARLGFKIYPSTTECPRGSVYIRRTSDGNCMCEACRTLRSRISAKSSIGWRENNKDTIKKHKTRWAEKNIEKIREKNRNYKKTNAALVLAATRIRQLKKKQATPAWADLEKIKAFYLEAATKTKQTGVRHHVDHIIPISAKNVCGLHVHQNLQVITAEENMKKGCRFEDGRN